MACFGTVDACELNPFRIQFQFAVDVRVDRWFGYQSVWEDSLEKSFLSRLSAIGWKCWKLLDEIILIDIHGVIFQLILCSICSVRSEVG